MKRVAVVLITSMIIVGTSFAVFAAPSPSPETETTTYTDIYGNLIPLAGLDEKDMPVTVTEDGRMGNVSPKTGEGFIGAVLLLLAGVSAVGMVWAWPKSLQR